MELNKPNIDIGFDFWYKGAMKKRVAVYWLIPAKAEKELFREIVRILSRQLDAPLFEPHLTLLAANIPVRSARAVLRKIDVAPIRLSLRDIGFSNQFTKTLFVRFKPNYSLARVLKTLGPIDRFGLRLPEGSASQSALQEIAGFRKTTARFDHSPATS